MQARHSSGVRYIYSSPRKAGGRYGRQLTLKQAFRMTMLLSGGLVTSAKKRTWPKSGFQVSSACQSCLPIMRLESTLLTPVSPLSPLSRHEIDVQGGIAVVVAAHTSRSH